MANRREGRKKKREKRIAESVGKATIADTSSTTINNIASKSVGKASRYDPNAYDMVYESILDQLNEKAKVFNPELDLDSFGNAFRTYDSTNTRYLDYRKKRASLMTDRIDNAIEKRMSFLTESVPAGKLQDAIFDDKTLQRAYSSRSAWEKYGKAERGVFSDFKNIKKTASSEAAESAAKIAGEGAVEAAKTAGKEAAEKVAKKSAGDLWDLAKKNKVPQIALGVGVTAWIVNKMSDSRGQQSNGQLYGQGY